MKWEYSAGIIPFAGKEGERKYLLLESNLTRNQLWEFPKGGIEKGEDSLAAASREFEEETGIHDWQHVPGFKKTIKYFYRRDGDLIGKTVTYFLGKVNRMNVEISSESKGFVWLIPEEAEKKLKQKTLKALLREAEIFLQGSV